MPNQINLIPIEKDRVMKISINDLNTKTMVVTEKGMELRFRETDGTHTGDLIITPTKLIWNKRKTSKHGKSINWPEFFKFMQKK